jgi:signal transduction histidine kinase
MRLRTKLAVVLVVVALLLTGGVYAATDWVERQQVRATQESTDDGARQVAEQLDGTMVQHSDTVRYYALRFAAAESAADEQLLRTVVRGNRFLRGGTLVDPNGTVVAHEGDLPRNGTYRTVGANVGDRPGVARTVDDADVDIHVGDPKPIETTVGDEANTTQFSGEYAVTITAVAVDRSGRPQAVFVAHVPIGYRTGFASLRALNTSSQSAALIADDTRVFESGEGYERNVTGRAVMDETGWVVEVTRDRGPLDRTREQLALAQVIGVIGVLGIVGGFGSWEYRTNLRQTQRLLSAFDRAKSGDYDHELALESGDEWERIGEGYNDLTDGLAERERALREREQRLDVLNRVLRHNLRNGMTVVVGHAEYVAEVGNDQLERSARSILSAGEDLTNLSERAREIQEVRATADERIDADAADLAREAVETARAGFPDVSIDLDAESAPLWAVPTVATAVEQILDNACRYNEGDRQRVRVSTGVGNRDGRSVAWITVQDDGPGIPEQEQSVLKEGRETALEHGSGLGLWLVYWVVRESNGRLGFDVRNGEGTKVTMEFPAGADGGPEESTLAADADNDSGEPDGADERPAGSAAEGDAESDAGGDVTPEL